MIFRRIAKANDMRAAGVRLFPAALVAMALLVAPVLGRADAATTPNDPQFPSQYAPAKVRATQAWDVTRGSTAIKVAVVDTGISPLPDLSGQLGAGYNAITPGGSYADDFGGYGIGTLIGGILGARTNNGADMAGTAWNITMMPVKVCDFGGTCHTADIAEGINWAVNNGAHVIHISIGLAASSADVDAAVANALNRGVIVVAASGNVATRVGYPASIPGVVAVGATDANDGIASFSGQGSAVDIVAPGLSVLTLVRGGCCLTRSGTELAAAHVSGAAALLLAAGVAPSQVSLKLVQGARDLGPAGKDNTFGYGLLDICGSLSAAGKMCPVGGTSPTNTPAVATATPTRTNTPAAATATPTGTNTPAAATATPTRTNTPAAATATPTRTNTPAVATPTYTPGPRTDSISGRLKLPSTVFQESTYPLYPGRTLTANASWNGSATVNLVLYSPSGAEVARASGRGSVTLRYSANTTGNHRLRIELASGQQAAYSLTVTY